MVILARHFVERFARELNKPASSCHIEAIEALSAYPWPGNVRELQNCIERAAILCEDDTIHAAQSQPVAAACTVDTPRRPARWDQIDLSGTLPDAFAGRRSEIERRKLEQALKDAAGQKARAAELLGLNYKVLVHKLRSIAVRRVTGSRSVRSPAARAHRGAGCRPQPHRQTLEQRSTH